MLVLVWDILCDWLLDVVLGKEFVVTLALLAGGIWFGMFVVAGLVR